MDYCMWMDADDILEEAEREMQTHPCDRKICRRIILQPVLITRDTLRKIGFPEDPDGH